MSAIIAATMVGLTGILGVPKGQPGCKLYIDHPTSLQADRASRSDPFQVRSLRSIEPVADPTILIYFRTSATFAGLANFRVFFVDTAGLKISYARRSKRIPERMPGALLANPFSLPGSPLGLRTLHVPPSCNPAPANRVPVARRRRSWILDSGRRSFRT